MQNSMQRFRLSLVSDQQNAGTSHNALEIEGSRVPQRTHTTRGGHNESVRQTGPSACVRCRRFKKKCTRIGKEDCSSCIAASSPCFSVDRSSRKSQEKQLQSRIAWLTKIVNDALPQASPSIESIETGKDISLLTALRQNPLPTTAHKVPSVGSRSPGGTRNNAIDSAPPKHGSMHGEDVEEGSEPVSTETARVSTTSSENGRPVSRLPQDAAGRRFIDAYFRHVHLAYPFLDRGQVLLDLEAVGNPMLQAGQEGIPVKLFVIMAIGCTTLQRAGQVGNELSSRFVISYQNTIHECLRKNNIESLELLMLLALYSLFDPDGISPWAITGIVTRQAILLGLTQNASLPNGLYSQQAELRNRLFWSVYVLDRVISASYGLPPNISDETVNVPLPGITIQEYASAECQYYARTLQVSRQIIALQQLEAKILQKIHLAPSQMTIELTRLDKRAILHDLRDQVENWYKQGCVLSGSALLEQDNIPFHNTISWLNFRYQNLLVLLHCPSQFNSQFSLEALTGLQTSAQKYLQSSAILLQQRHLPLNWVMLCRFLAMGALLLNCFNRQRSIGKMTYGCIPCANCAQQRHSIAATSISEALFEATAELRLCADILEFFPERWQVARRSAQAFRRFAEYVSSENASIVRDPSNEQSARSEDLSLQTVRNDIVSLAREVLGETSIYTIAAAAVADESGIDLISEWSYLQRVDSSNADAGVHNASQPFSRPTEDADLTLGLNQVDGFGPDDVSNLGLGIF